MNRKFSAAIVLAVVMIACALGFGVTKFEFSNDYREFFSDDNPQLRAWEELKHTYVNSDSVLIAVSPRKGTIYARDVIDAIREITREVWRIPYAVRVDSLTNHQDISATADEIQISDLVPEEALIDQDLVQHVRDVAAEDPELVNLIVGRDGTIAGINVTVQLSDKPREEIEEIHSYMRELLPKLKQAYPQLDFYVSGSVPYNYALAEATKADLKSVVLYMYGLVLLVLFFLFRSVCVVLIGALSITLVNVSAMGSAGWVGILLMAPNLSAPSILMTLMIANLIHVLVAFFQRYEPGMDRGAVIRDAIQVNRKPIFITNLTTSIGFLSMNFSEVPPYRDLGNIVAIGVVYVLGLTLYFLPHLIVLLPIKPIGKRAQRVGSFYRFVSNIVIARSGLVCGAFAMIIVLSAFGVSRLEFNDRFAEWLGPAFQFRQDTDYINQHLTGFYMLEWSLSAGGEGGVNDPNYLRQVDAFHEWMASQPGVVHVDSMATDYKELNQHFHGGDPAHYGIPADKDSAAQLLLVYEMSLPLGLDINNMVNIDKSASRFVVRTSNLSANELLDLESRGVEWLRQNASAPMVSPAGSTTILFSHIAKRNIDALLGGTLAALVLISLMMVVPFRSFLYGTLSLAPNLFPAFAAFGVWGLTIGNVGLAVSVVVGMTMGVVVDDTIHLLNKYIHYHRKLGLSPEAAVEQTLFTVGPAVTGTTIILAAGFGVLAFSDLNLNSQMGILTALTVVIAWLADMFFLPALLLVIERRGRQEKTEAAVVRRHAPDVGEAL